MHIGRNPEDMKRLITALTISILLFNYNANASHLVGGEITFECLSSGSNAGKMVFHGVLYRACYLGAASLGSNMTINNPLYPVYGGPSTISMSRTSTSDLLSQLTTNCYDTSLWFGCNNTIANGGQMSVQKNTYQSSPIQVNGIPSSTGSDFWWSSCCRPASTLVKNINGSGYWLRTTMFPYTDPFGNTKSLGSTSAGPTCYDSSPEFAQDPSIVLCGKRNSYYVNTTFDVNNDSLVYSLSTPKQSSTSLVTWRSGYSEQYQLPDTSEDTLNIGPFFDSTNGVLRLNTNSPFGGYYFTCIKSTSYRNGQKIAEVYRDVVLSIIDCDTIIPSGSTTPMVNASAPTIEIKDATSSSYLTNFHAFYPLGAKIELDIKTFDAGLLPVSPPKMQSVDLTVEGPSISTVPNDTLNCQQPPCAFMDSNNVSWNGSIFTDTTIVTARFEWNTSCQNMADPASAFGYRRSKQFNFTANSYDNWCPIPAQGINVFSITLVDTNGHSWLIDTLNAITGDVRISWPKYLASGFSSYEIYRSNSPTSSGTLIASISNVNTTRYTDVTANADTGIVYYYIRINNSTGCDQTFEYRTTHLEAAASGLSAVLNWNTPYADSSMNSGTHTIYRFDSSVGPWYNLGSVPFGVETFTDTTAIPNTPMAYLIHSTDAYGLTSFSNMDSLYIVYVDTSNNDTTITDTSNTDTSNTDTTTVGYRNYKQQYLVDFYPNPFDDVVVVQSHSSTENTVLDVFGMTGEKLLSVPIADKNQSVDLSEYNSGVYIFRVIQNGETLLTRRLVKH